MQKTQLKVRKMLFSYVRLGASDAKNTTDIQENADFLRAFRRFGCKKYN